jgi:hypothetical protein
MKPIGKLDTSHAMYQPDKRVKRHCRLPIARAISDLIQQGAIIPDRNGSQAEREAWVRARQAVKSEASRESRLIAEAESVVQRRRIRQMEKELRLRRELQEPK